MCAIEAAPDAKAIEPEVWLPLATAAVVEIVQQLRHPPKFGDFFTRRYWQRLIQGLRNPSIHDLRERAKIVGIWYHHRTESRTLIGGELVLGMWMSGHALGSPKALDPLSAQIVGSAIVAFAIE